MKKIIFFLVLNLFYLFSSAQPHKPAPPMGWMSWNLFGININEQVIRGMADAMVSSGMKDAGYEYIIIDDGWQGGRDNRNNIIPDPQKFPSGMKALADYLHSKDLKLGIYSDAAPLTCANFTGSLHFEEQDAKTFAAWGIDYLKYDYCNAPQNADTAKIRYRVMADALVKSGRPIVFGACNWGFWSPWLWARDAGAQLWRSADDIADMWQKKSKEIKSEGIMDVIDKVGDLHEYAGPGYWNDPDMLVVGLYGKGGPSGMGGATGCTDTEYQTNMSLWCLMASPLITSCDLGSMNETTRKIFLNKDIIAINQDALNKPAVRKIKNDNWHVFVKTLENDEFAIGVLNSSGEENIFELPLSDLGLDGKYMMHDLWTKTITKSTKNLNLKVASHETKVFRLTRIK